MFNSDNATDCRGSRTDHGHTDLDYGKKAVGILLQLFHHLCPFVAFLNQLCDTAFPDGDNGKFGTGEKPIDNYKDKNQQQFQGHGIQKVLLIFGSSSLITDNSTIVYLSSALPNVNRGVTHTGPICRNTGEKAVDKSCLGGYRFPIIPR